MLSLIVFSPLIGVAVLLGAGETIGSSAGWACWRPSPAWFSLLCSATTAGPEFQFREDIPWIDAFGIRYTLGVDGLSAVLVLLTTVLSVVAILYSWAPIQNGSRSTTPRCCS